MSTIEARPAATFSASTGALGVLAGVLRLSPAAAGLACWVYSLDRLQVNSLGLYGVLASVDAWFFVGLALLIGGFAVELARGQRQLWVLVVYVLSIVVVIDATVPLLYHTPEYQWVFKHIGVAQTLKVNGRVIDPNDIYQAWPTFFSVVAAISSLSGASPITFATWAPLFFELANCLALLAIFRSMTRDSRVPILAVLLFECLVCWVGQDYLSPQAFAYLLWLGLIGVVLRWLSGYAPRESSPGMLDRLRGRLLRGFEYRPAPERGLKIAAVMIVIALFFVIVSSHQLTPYIALAGLACLAALGLLRPRWLVPVLALIAVGFLLPRYHIVSSQYGGLFSGFNVINNASAPVKVSEPAATFSEHLASGLAVMMWLAAIALVLRSVRSPGRVAIPAVLAFSPFLVLLVQSYGGEATYRVVLFSAPWCAYLIANAVVGLRWSPLRIAATALVPAIVLLAGLQALYGPVTVNAFTPAEINASQWLYGHAPAGSSFILAAENFPVEESARTASYSLPVLPSDPHLGVGEDWLDAGDLPEVNSWTASLSGKEKFLVLSRSMVAYSSFFGFPRDTARLEAELPSSPDWTLYFKNADVTIYHFTPVAVATRSIPRRRPRPTPLPHRSPRRRAQRRAYVEPRISSPSQAPAEPATPYVPPSTPAPAPAPTPAPSVTVPQAHGPVPTVGSQSEGEGSASFDTSE